MRGQNAAKGTRACVVELFHELRGRVCCWLLSFRLSQLPRLACVSSVSRTAGAGLLAEAT